MGLEDEFGVWTEDEDQMGSLVSTYFDTMFTTSNPTGFEEILNGLVPTVTEEMNNSLNKPYTAEEVLKALHHMALSQFQALMVCPLYFTKHFGILLV